MEKTVHELKTIIRELIIEVGELKERLTDLEHRQLRAESGIIEEPKPLPMILESEAYENLGKVYSKGYHVCPTAYGQPRDDECLFCIAFMEKE